MPDSSVRQIKIMISSTRADLAQYREEASKVIKKVAAEKEKHVQLVEVSMERETQSGEREFAVEVSKRWVEEADWVLVIVGWNYGTISDEEGAAGLSVTEWEYRHAMESRKKLFVFMSGEPGTTNQYRVSDDEINDLKDWIPQQSKEQKEKLASFRKALASRHADMYANLAWFKERLEKTLKDAIDDLPPAIHAGTPLAELIVSVTPDIRDCIRRVTWIANCKRIHDYLHELLQHVIRPLREEVLSPWHQEGTLSASRERTIWGCLNKASRQQGAIGEVRKSIGAEHWELRDGVDKVLNAPDLWDMEANSADSVPSWGEFTEAVEKFADDVQDAFSEADRSMMLEETELRERYLALLEGLKRARRQKNLSVNDHNRLDEELEKIDANRARVKDCLTMHHRWQEVHDKLHQLDSFRETKIFDKQLRRFCDTWPPRVLNLVEQELGEARKTDVQRDSAVSSVHETTSTTSVKPRINAFIQDLQRLEESVEALCQGDGAAAFDKLRKPFDDAFYVVDKRALEEIERAGNRAASLSDWLEELSRGQPRKD